MHPRKEQVIRDESHGYFVSVGYRKIAGDRFHSWILYCVFRKNETHVGMKRWKVPTHKSFYFKSPLTKG